jgi:monoamine oxidase
MDSEADLTTSVEYVGFRPYTISQEEVEHMPEFSRKDAAYCRLRNPIVHRWFQNPTKYLSVSEAQDMFPADDAVAVARVHGYLQQFGRINHGVYTMPEEQKRSHVVERKRVVVIGAGAAGIGAACQLQAAGFDVTVLEAQDRIGGRVHTSTKFSAPVDLGASLMTGAIGNPVTVLAKQTDAPMHFVDGEAFTLYGPDGKALESDMDRRMQDVMDELHIGISYLAHGDKILENDAGGTIRYQLSQFPSIRPWQREKAERSSLDDAIQHMRRMYQLEANDEETQVFAWHIANLEYGCATTLDKLSLRHWDQDDATAYTGQHALMSKGYSHLLEELVKHYKLDIRLRSVVDKVVYNNSGVHIHVSSEDSGSSVIDADYAVVTVSLGVLQRGLIEFQPQLPGNKTTSISRLGLGNLNKIVLEFPQVFWKANEDMTGCIASDVDDRGCCYMFWNIARATDAPILAGLLAGEWSQKAENMTTDELRDLAMASLRRIYGNDIPDPIVAESTSWASNPYVGGCYSYIGLHASGRDFDVMAHPVDNRLFFAGEATNRKHTASVPGAYSSGLRAAGEILGLQYQWRTVQVKDVDIQFRSQSFTSLRQLSSFGQLRRFAMYRHKESADEKRGRLERRKQLAGRLKLLMSGVTPDIKSDYDIQAATSSARIRVALPKVATPRPPSPPPQDAVIDIIADDEDSADALLDFAAFSKSTASPSSSSKRKRKHHRHSERKVSSSSSSGRKRSKVENDHGGSGSGGGDGSSEKPPKKVLYAYCYKALKHIAAPDLPRHSFTKIASKAADRLFADWEAAKTKGTEFKHFVKSSRVRNVKTLVEKYHSAYLQHKQ